ncbi:hypothetical protein GCM10009682_06630 [Luedemannella flava]|uniref:Acyl-CoA carboxylase subunit epsilon n=1 Tax=Luedemannella flava TaxID=349316 RepID=A0ABP4XLE5_9ACTN
MDVVRGAPTSEELAALVGALAALSAAAPPPPAPPSRWARTYRPTR